ncbi:NADH:ubiquinone reductase (Na(+)-transporting) subunit F [Desulfobotulus sp. H1]|uniref:Na(+)-translocating NADH-quinone reductase subunit F n=1 Tax=Desulfobotulus pelophilus TaxID=2823377 RepID=A0ABT3NBU6_9BACT|nr:NADH:ubiquinone reductase (Na(+)-transporting) subunit F [Desulfobotulus pelophilus]MCW7754929.1 NADH:ubiquinone reductase (Na(+)-transporting) subunit F [Desulfobotulus pelophilus]
MIFLVSFVVFTGVTLSLVLLLLFVESRLVKKEDSRILINGDEDKSITVSTGSTLLSSLVSQGILLPSACGGGGTCAMCKCKVLEGGGDVLPTELSHLSRKEKAEGIRLACQLKVRNNLSIAIPEEIFSIRKYHATVVSNRSVGTYIKELLLKVDPDEDFSFEAGQYIQIDIPEYKLSFSDFSIPTTYVDDWDKYQLWNIKARSEERVFRAYSLANPPYEDQPRLTVRIATPPEDQPDAPPGVGSSFIFNLKEGEKITFSGPYGDFLVKDSEKEICFVGGGAGMAPMRSHILHQLNTLHTKRKITFWYGARSRREMFYDDDFKSLREKYPNFHYQVALSEPLPEDQWDGPTGFIHQVLYESYLKKHEDPSEIEYYLCGPPVMVDAVVDILWNLGVEEEMIAYDKF